MHRLEHFKSFADVSIDLFKPLTVLIGPNGVGKTNLIEAIELLAFVGGGQPVHEVSDIGRGGRFEVRGGMQACARKPSPTFSLRFIAIMPFGSEQLASTYTLTLAAAATPAIDFEQLRVGDRVVFEAATAGAGLLRVQYDNFNKGPNKPTTTVPSNRSVLSQYEAFATGNKRFADCSTLIGALRQYLAQSYAFDPHPRLMRDYDRVGNSVLQRDGGNLSAVLYGLAIGTAEQKEALSRIVERIKHVPEESFESIGFEVTKLGDVLFGLTRADGSMVDARLLSDGTLRALAVLTALETCSPVSRLVVEEFDNGIHPSRVKGLCAAMVEGARRRNLNVLVTTHNPATLDALPEEAMEGVIVAHWSTADNAAKLTPLLELPRVAELLQRGRLGDLVTRRVLESYFSAPSDAERAAQAKAWLEALGA